MYRIGQIMEELTLELIQYRTLLTFKFDESDEFQILEAILLSNLNLTSYRSVYHTYFDVEPALDLLFLNRQNPISILSQFEQLQKYISLLPQKDDTQYDEEIRNLVFECYSQARLISLEKLGALDVRSNFRYELDRYCEEMSDKIAVLSDKLTARYFSHTVYQYQGSQTGFDLEV